MSRREDGALKSGETRAGSDWLKARCAAAFGPFARVFIVNAGSAARREYCTKHRINDHREGGLDEEGRRGREGGSAEV